LNTKTTGSQAMTSPERNIHFIKRVGAYAGQDGCWEWADAQLDLLGELEASAQRCLFKFMFYLGGYCLLQSGMHALRCIVMVRLSSYKTVLGKNALTKNAITPLIFRWFLLFLKLSLGIKHVFVVPCRCTFIIQIATEIHS